MDQYQDDPVFRESKREAFLILGIWFLCLLWTVGCCYWTGYSEHPQTAGDMTSVLPDISHRDRSTDDLTTPFGLGVPEWVFWGIVFPWIISGAFSCWFCLFYMKDDSETLNPSSQEGQSE